MVYRVLCIDEDIDYGCEERQLNSEVQAIVTLEDENGAKSKIRVADGYLYEAKIEEGDMVVFKNEKSNLLLKYEN